MHNRHTSAATRHRHSGFDLRSGADFRINNLEMVDQNSASWNQLLPWLRWVDTLRAGEVLTG